MAIEESAERGESGVVLFCCVLPHNLLDKTSETDGNWCCFFVYDINNVFVLSEVASIWFGFEK